MPLVNGPFGESGGVFSPEGRWLAYYSARLIQKCVLRFSEAGKMADFNGWWHIFQMAR